MKRYHLIALCVVLLPSIAYCVGIGLIMSANEEVRTLLQNPTVATGFLQCFVDRSRISFQISQQIHLHTITDVISSFILKSSHYPITDTDALLFQTELASSIVDVVVNEPSRQEDYAQTLATLIRILRDCYAQSTEKQTTDLAIIIETFTKLFVDVIVNVEKSSSSKISADEQKLLQAFEQVERYGFVNGEGSIKTPLELALESEIDAEKSNSQATQSAFQSNIQKPTIITTTIEKPISINTNLPASPYPSDLITIPVLQKDIISNKNLNTISIVSLNSTSPGSSTLKSATDVYLSPQIDTLGKISPTSITNGNSNAVIASALNQGGISTSGSTALEIQIPAKPLVPSNLATINSQDIQAPITGENVNTIAKSNFPEPVQSDLSKTRIPRSISSSNLDIPTNQNGIKGTNLTRDNLINISEASTITISSNPSAYTPKFYKNVIPSTSDQNKIVENFPTAYLIKLKSKYNLWNNNGIFSGYTQKENSYVWSKLFRSAIKKLIQSGSEKILSDLMHDDFVKDKFFEPKFVEKIKEQASEIILNTITSLSMTTRFPKTIGEVLTKLHSPEFINNFALTLYDAVKGAAHLEKSTSFASLEGFYEGIRRKKRDNTEKVYQEFVLPEITPDTSFPSTVSAVSSATAITGASDEVSARSTISTVSSATTITGATAEVSAGLTSEISVKNNFVPSAISTIPSPFSDAEAPVEIYSNISELTAINNVNVEEPKNDVLLYNIDVNVPLVLTNDAANTNEAKATTDYSLSSITEPARITNSKVAVENLFQPSFANTYPFTSSEAVASSEISSVANNIDSTDIETNTKTEIFLDDITDNKNSFESSGKSEETSNNFLPSLPSPDSKTAVTHRHPPAIVTEFSSAFSKAVATSETVTSAVELTLHGPTADNTIYEIIFTSLSEKGISDPTVENREPSYPIASNLEGMTPLVFTNALSGAVADTLLEEGLLTFKKIPKLVLSYIRILEQTLNQLEAGNDPELNSKALVIGTERFLTSRGISVLHGASELVSHFKEDFISAWEDISNSRNSDSLFPDNDKEESNDAKVPALECKSDTSNATSFSAYLLNELSNANTLKELFALPQMTEETAYAFYRSFYSAALSLGIEIPKIDGDLLSKVLSKTLDKKSPTFFATIYATSLEKFLCKRGILAKGSPLAMSRLFGEILNKTPSGTNIAGNPYVYFDLLTSATFRFLISILIIKPISPVSWTSNFLSELISSSPVSLARLIREVAPEILLPAGLRHSDATHRIYDLTVYLAHDILSSRSNVIHIPAFAQKMEVTFQQIRKSNPALKPIGLYLGTFLEAISAMVTLINAAEISNLNVVTGDSTAIKNEVIRALIR